MRIAFTGASGTGKSTLARLVAKEFSWPMNPIGAREVARAMGFDTPYAVDAAGKRREFQERLLKEKMAWEREHDSFVTDRTVIDNLTYAEMHEAPPSTELFAQGKAHFTRYDGVFVCWWGDFQKLDPWVHQMDSAYHNRFEKRLMSHYRDSVWRTVWIVPRGTLELRTEQVFDWIRHLSRTKNKKEEESR